MTTEQTEHVHTDKCGFDRNSSHSEGVYVCECGWRERATNSAGQVASSLTESASDHSGAGDNPSETGREATRPVPADQARAVRRSA